MAMALSFFVTVLTTLTCIGPIYMVWVSNIYKLIESKKQETYLV